MMIDVVTFFTCAVCKKRFRRDVRSKHLGCGVIHLPLDCCHYGDKEVKDATTEVEGLTISQTP